MTKVVLHTCPSISRTRSQTDLDYVQGFSLLFPLQQYSGYNFSLASAPLPLRHPLSRRRRLFPLDQGRRHGASLPFLSHARACLVN
jgi:hypothetical protein